MLVKYIKFQATEHFQALQTIYLFLILIIYQFNIKVAGLNPADQLIVQALCAAEEVAGIILWLWPCSCNYRSKCEPYILIKFRLGTN